MLPCTGIIAAASTVAVHGTYLPTNAYTVLVFEAEQIAGIGQLDCQ